MQCNDSLLMSISMSMTRMRSFAIATDGSCENLASMSITNDEFNSIISECKSWNQNCVYVVSNSMKLRRNHDVENESMTSGTTNLCQIWPHRWNTYRMCTPIEGNPFAHS